jgi:2-keto-3-deoxy-L-rhamnonate aldolase RhmA
MAPLGPEPSMKERLAGGETLLGTFLAMGSPMSAEACGLAGFDWVLVDLEHGGGHESSMLAQLLGATSAGVHGLVRVESAERMRAARALDYGAEGVMVPQMPSATAAREWVAHLHYGPAGHRGVATNHRAARYGLDPESLTRAAARTVGIVQIESMDAVQDSEEIAAIDGIDVLFVGPSDLSYSMGRFRQFDDPQFRGALERVVAAAENAGKAAGIMVAGPEGVAAAAQDGFRMIAVGTDVSLMVQGARAAVAALNRS